MLTLLILLAFGIAFAAFALLGAGLVFAPIYNRLWRRWEIA